MNTKDLKKLIDLVEITDPVNGVKGIERLNP